MEDSKPIPKNDVVDEFHDAPDDFTFSDCPEFLPQPIEFNDDVSNSPENPNPSPGETDIHPPGIRRRRSDSHVKSSAADSDDLSRPSSSVNLGDYLRERKLKLRSRKNKDLPHESEVSPPSEITEVSEPPAIGITEVSEPPTIRENEEKSEEGSTVTNEIAGDNSRDDPEGDEWNSNLLLTAAGIVVKSITFQIGLLVKIFTFPIWLSYYLYMLFFDPFGLSGLCKAYLFQKTKGVWKFVYDIVSKFTNDWFKEHQSIWRLGLKCGWGLLWSFYVCAVLVGLLLSAFVISGILIRSVVEEPIQMKRSLNFDYKEKSPVAFVSIMTGPELIQDMYLDEKHEIGKGKGSRVIPANHNMRVTVSLTLPESDYNQNLGVFQVRVDFLAADGKTLARSRRPCMLQFRSKPIRLLLTLLKVAPILTGYTSETQDLKVNFRGFTEGNTPTAGLNVVIEPRAEFLPGAGIPEVYDASLTLESELPLMRKALWFWKKTLFVWISMVIFTTELFFVLLCCRPIVIPRIRLRGGPNGGASRRGGPGRS